MLYEYVLVIAATVISVVAQKCPNRTENIRFDCFPTPGGSQTLCEARGCCWDSGGGPTGAPPCFYPDGYSGYTFMNVTENPSGQLAYLKRSFRSPYPRDVNIIRIQAEYISSTTLRVKIDDPANQRYESPYPKIEERKQSSRNYQYKFDLAESKTGFKIARSNGDVIFDAQDKGDLVFADQFLEISASMTASHFYGLSEHRANLDLEKNWTTYTMFNHDVPPRPEVRDARRECYVYERQSWQPHKGKHAMTNLYGSHPFLLAVDSNGSSFGVFLHSSNAIDIVLQPFPAITYRSIGGILDFYFFMGPTPMDVIRQYITMIGKPQIPPYWGLGFQLCRYIYGSTEGVRKIWQRNRDAKIPFDVQWTDYDYMINHTDFTLDNTTYGDLPEFIEELHDVGMHYVPMLDPGFSGSEIPGTYPPYDLAVDADLLVKDKDGQIFQGLVWNDVSTVWPDFTNPEAHKYWTQLLTEFHDLVPFDGLWIDMNEPSNFVNGSLTGCPEDELEHPPYVPNVDGGFLSYMTICMSAQQYAGSHYNTHNIFGIAEAEATNFALRSLGKRPFIISRSTFAGSGKYTGHWSGDNSSTWYDLLKSIQELLTSSMMGISFTGADICGFRENTTQEMCNRWTQLGAFYTFARNHNDPAAFDPETIDSIRKVLQIRYTLLPYLYTLLYQAYKYGEPAARPLFLEYYDDPNVYNLTVPFMWGRGLMIIPVVEEGVTEVTTYLPTGIWYDWYNGSAMYSTGIEVTLSAPYDVIPLLVRGGTILPAHFPGVTTTESRENGFILFVAPDLKGNAQGELYWDDGAVIDPVENKIFGLVKFNLEDNLLTTKVQQWITPHVPKLEAVKIFGITILPNSTLVNGNKAFSSIHEGILTIDGFSVSMNNTIEVTWE